MLRMYRKLTYVSMKSLPFTKTTLVNNLKEALPSPVAEAIKQDFTTPPANADLAALKTFNDDFLKRHSDSPAHLQRGYNVRFHLDPNSKSQDEKDLQKLLSLDSVTLQQAIAGSALLEEWKSDGSAIDAYREAAAKKWPQATTFQNK
jgi:hypothetical protein